MAKAGVYHTDADSTEIDMLEAINFSAESINVGIITASNLTLGISSIVDSPSNNYQLKFYLLANSQLTVSVRGSDGTVRTGIVSLT